MQTCIWIDQVSKTDPLATISSLKCRPFNPYRIKQIQVQLTAHPHHKPPQASAGITLPTKLYPTSTDPSSPLFPVRHPPLPSIAKQNIPSITPVTNLHGSFNLLACSLARAPASRRPGRRQDLPGSSPRSRHLVLRRTLRPSASSTAPAHALARAHPP